MVMKKATTRKKPAARKPTSKTDATPPKKPTQVGWAGGKPRYRDDAS
ncbi:hypothetical protein [Parvibaculum sp.]